jgi:dephospho-CoA kinase
MSASLGPLVIGLTGGIGSGKSTVAAMFEERGARIIDTDVLSRELTQAGGAAIAAIRAAFGDAYIDAEGTLQRGKMRALVFSDRAAKQRLETILHPAIRALVWQRLKAATPAPYTLLVVPLLFETRAYQDCMRRTLLVDCPEHQQITRTMQRSGMSREEVQSIMAQQLNRAQRAALADDILCNDADLPALTGQVAHLHGKYLTIATGSD